MPCTDGYNRPIQYLRVSVTDRCNLRCIYCMPEEGVTPLSHDDVLRYEEIARVVRVAVELGFVHIRLTGGEPLVRQGIVDLVAELAAIPGLDDLSMTTNGILLARYAEPLVRAGLRRVNISLDSLRPERFRQLTRWGRLEDVLEGRRAALAAGLHPVKVNTVVVRGVNDDEVVELARLTRQPDWHVRFIEMMPLGATTCAIGEEGACWSGDGAVSAEETRARIEMVLGPLAPAHPAEGVGPARYYRLPDAAGTIGFISPLTEHFCPFCNRLRLTADGRLLPCLLSDVAIDLRTSLRAGADGEQIRQLFQQAVLAKPQSHHLAEPTAPACLPMSRIGG